MNHQTSKNNGDLEESLIGGSRGQMLPPPPQMKPSKSVYYNVYTASLYPQLAPLINKLSSVCEPVLALQIG